MFRNYSHYFSYKDKIFTTGAKLDLSFFEGRFSIDNEKNYNFGLSLFSDNYLTHIPVKLKFQYGNLSTGGSLSKLNNPLTGTSVSGFTNCYSVPAVITSTLPSSGQFTNPLSTFLELSYKNKNKFFNEILFNCAYTPETKDLSFSIKNKFIQMENLSLLNSFSFCFFTQNENDSSSWYVDIPYYRENKNYCFSSQTAINLFNFSSNFSLFYYNSPFGKKDFIYKTENKFETDHFTYSLSCLFNRADFIVSRNNKILEPCTEIKGNIQYEKEFENKNKIKTGITAFYNILPLEENNDFKIGFSTLFSTELTSILVASSFTYDYLKDNNKMNLNYVSANLQNRWNFRLLSPSIGISSQYYISSKDNSVSENYKINLDFDILKKLITNKNSFSFSVKDNGISNKKINSSVNINFSLKKINIFGKISAEFRL